MVNIIIDGKSFLVDPCQTLLSAAATCGIEIPSLCSIDSFYNGCDYAKLRSQARALLKLVKLIRQKAWQSSPFRTV